MQHIDKIGSFSAIAEAGSLHGAARRLGISQPALTQTVKILESALGCQLITRSRTGVELTSAGRILYESSVRIHHEVRVLGEQLTLRQDMGGQKVRVGIIDSIAIYAWPHAQQTLAQVFTEASISNCEFDLSTGRTADLLEKLQLGEVDIAVVVEPEIGAHQDKVELYRDCFYLYCSPEDPHRQTVEGRARGALTIPRPLFLFEGARGAGSFGLKSFPESHQLAFANVSRVDSFEIAVEFVRAGLGFSLLPERVVKRFPDGLHRPALRGRSQEPFGAHGIYACATRSYSAGRPFRMFCQALRQSQGGKK